MEKYHTVTLYTRQHEATFVYFVHFRYAECLVKCSDKKSMTVSCDLFRNRILVTATNEYIFEATDVSNVTETAIQKVVFCKKREFVFCSVLFLSISIPSLLYEI